MPRIRPILVVVIPCLIAACATTNQPASRDFAASDDLQYLEELLAAVLDSARVPAAAAANGVTNSSGFTLIRRGGGDVPAAFFIRDIALSLDAGLITPDEQRHALLQTAFHQQDGELRLPSGVILPNGAIPDHITLDGNPDYFSTPEEFGATPLAQSPCFDTPYFFIHMAYYYTHTADDFAILSLDVRGKTLIKRLQEAYAMPPNREDTGLIYIGESAGNGNFGFYDTVTYSGELLFCSLLKHRAAIQLAYLLDATGNQLAADLFREDAAAIQQAIAATFVMENGFLRASNGQSAQPDVWGTAFAVYSGLLAAETSQRASFALAQSYRDGVIASRGGIRQVPSNAGFSADTAWEIASTEVNRYQNGGYFGMAVGWVAFAIAIIDLPLAEQLMGEYVAALREDDFRRGGNHGAPWLWTHPNGNHRAHPIHLATVAAPLPAFWRIAEARQPN